MNYRIHYDGTNSTIKLTYATTNELTVFSTFNTAKQMLLLYLRQERDNYNDAITRVRSLRIRDIEVSE